MQNNAELGSISVIYTDQNNNEGAKGFGSNIEEVVRKVGELSVTTIGENLRRLCEATGSLLQHTTLSDLPYILDEVELTVEVAGSGEVRLVGSVGAELSGGIKLTFKRR